jgi:hypothetical protein
MAVGYRHKSQNSAAPRLLLHGCDRITYLMPLFVLWTSSERNKKVIIDLYQYFDRDPIDPPQKGDTQLTGHHVRLFIISLAFMKSVDASRRRIFAFPLNRDTAPFLGQGFFGQAMLGFMGVSVINTLEENLR